MTYEQYLKDFLADVIKATGMLFEPNNLVIEDSEGASISVENIDENFTHLFVTIKFDSSKTADEFAQDFAVHREAAVKLTAMAYAAQFFHAATLIADGKGELFELSLHEYMRVSITDTNEYEYFRKNWHTKDIVHKKTYHKPTTTQVKTFAKNSFLKAAHADAKVDVEDVVDRLKEYHADYVRTKERLDRIQKLLS